MVFAIRFVGGTFYTDWPRALHVEQKCVHALVQKVRTLHLAAGGTLAAKRRDWRNAASRREHVLTPRVPRSYWSVCLDWICRATPLFFFSSSSTLMDPAADSMNLGVLVVRLVFKHVRTPTTCLGRPRLYNCEVMFAGLSQESVTDNETNTQFPVLKCGETWE